MRRVGAVVIAVVAVAITGAQPSAQSVSDGVAAFLRADYARAAALLIPAAEDVWQPDPTAEVVLGMMYDNGLGVPADPVRACSLYVRATTPGSMSQTPATAPLTAAAMSLVRARQRSLGPAFQTCNWRAGVGYDDGFEPATFTLGPGHWVTWDVRGATVMYAGVEKRADLPLMSTWTATAHSVFLPLRYIPLDSGPARSIRRHFVEIPTWVPGRDRDTWMLKWMLCEIDRDAIVTVTIQQLATASGRRPPSAPADIDRLAQVRVNGSGDAEWVVANATPPLSGRIESPADRDERERRREEEQRVLRARRDADAAVDWTQVRDPHRPPVLRYADLVTEGCGNLFIEGFSEDRAESIRIFVDRKRIDVTNTRTLDLSHPTDGVDVQVHVAEKPARRSEGCSDVHVVGAVEEIWRPIGGSLTVEVSPRDRREPYLYRATVRIVGARFVSATGATANQREPIVLSASVGRGM